ncbi:hypothetical protein [Nocardioides sp. T2.26MG-1]|uniref:hypothetical protein n=1 Tax=Nocardioides sp. T2.26MG-1 TaxID=3041166 RepID=UPI002477B3F2|nr:hypothetical protein [Nocardioides sp. T2.26MG-1]CAI9419295.1 hypothetical protein HIDPHFAB_03621 [Nocardioides sp. T2.26MG-1]
MNLAHGLGGGSDLPIPASYAIAGGTAALTISFIILMLAWRRPRYDELSGGVRAHWIALVVDSRAFALTLRTAGLVIFGFVAWAAIFGRDLLTNPTFGVIYVWLWVGLVPLSLLFGPFYKAINPARTFHLIMSKLTGGDPDRGLLPYPPWLGYWPAAGGLLAFVWLELVYPDGTMLGPVRLWLAMYLAAMLMGGAIFGSRWLERADPFEVYSTLVGHLSIWSREASADGRSPGVLTLRSPLRNLASVGGEPGLVAVVAVLLGSTGFDSFNSSTFWVQFSQGTSADITLVNTALLIFACTLVGGTFSLATMATLVVPGESRRQLPRAMAHSIIPIIIGYIVAHYLTFFVEYGQQTLIQVSDPLSNGSNLLGTADWSVNYWLSEDPTRLATIKVLSIVIGHVLGVVMAHDRALQTIPKRHHVIGQLPLLAAMTLYTFGGLYLLFGL